VNSIGARRPSDRADGIRCIDPSEPSDPPEIIWRDYSQGADMEKRIAELKYDLAADDFCLREFFATEAPEDQARAPS
jgi:hypothetical protein